ncbi:MAG: class I SAM-dependent methyltransferase [Planctomycetota bacterium]
MTPGNPPNAPGRRAAITAHIRDAQDVWNRFDGAEYDRLFPPDSPRFILTDRPLIAAAHGRVLEVGCGTGRLAMKLPAGTRYVGTDLAGPLLARARGKGLAVVFGAGEELPFRNESFDAVLGGFYSFRDVLPSQGYREIHRVLTPGGRLVFTLLSIRLARLRAVLHHLKKFRRWPPADPPLPPDCHYFRRMTEETRLFRENGFRLRAVHSTLWLPVIHRILPVRRRLWTGSLWTMLADEVILVAVKPRGARETH